MNINNLIDNAAAKYHKDKRENLKKLKQCIGDNVFSQLNDAITKSLHNNLKPLSYNHYEIRCKHDIDISGVNTKAMKTLNKKELIQDMCESFRPQGKARLISTSCFIDYYISKFLMEDIIAKYNNNITVTSIFVKGFNRIIETPKQTLPLSIFILTIPFVIYDMVEYYRAMKKRIIPVELIVRFTSKKNILPYE
jgi:hypothetical protein